LYTLHNLYAAVPHLINYQGRLTDTSNAPLNGSYSITFRIFDAETAGTMLWEETQASVVVQKGIFSVLLGSVTNLGLAFDIPYFLEIKVGTEVMSPRQRITSAGYAIRAETAENANAVGNIGVNVNPEANKLLPLNGQAKIVSSAIPNILGNWVDKSTNYGAQQAATDGFVCVFGYGTIFDFSGYTDSNANPVTKRAQIENYTPGESNHTHSFMMPVRKNDYWKVVVDSGAITKVYWISLGN
ncbi:MAG: hypothetical protein ABH952_00050, partial [Candidatus Omnitrophota bacterium]